MAATLPTDRIARHLSRLENVQPTMAKADLKNLETAWREKVGAVVVKARQLAGLSQKELAAHLGHNDQSQVARWESGKERPQFDLLFSVDAMRQPLVIALAQLAGDGVEVETTVRIRRSA